MTTRDQQIAAAVIEAAAKAVMNVPLKEEFGRHPYFTDECKAMAITANSAIKSLDLDAILASVPKQEDGREEDEHLIARLSNLLAGIAVALRGPEKPLHRHGYADLPERVQILVLERDLLKFQVESIKEVAKEIHDFAHDKSAGPAIPDALWEVRSMAATIINDECLFSADSEGAKG